MSDMLITIIITIITTLAVAVFAHHKGRSLGRREKECHIDITESFGNITVTTNYKGPHSGSGELVATHNAMVELARTKSTVS